MDCGHTNQEIGGKLTRWVGLYDGVVWWSVKNVEVFSPIGVELMLL